MLQPELVVHKFFGWNILSLTMICILTILKYFVIILVLFIWLKMQNNIVRLSTLTFGITFFEIIMKKVILKLICFYRFSICRYFYKTTRLCSIFLYLGWVECLYYGIMRKDFFNNVYPFWCMTKRGRKS